MCKVKQLKPNHINIKNNGHKPQDKKATINAIRFRINQEIKLLYRKKHHLKHRLYYLHLDGANQHYGMLQHIQNSIDEQINRPKDNLYQKLNNKLHALTNQTST